MAGDEQRVRQDSDELLDAVEELRRMERLKRGHEISSPEFHELATRIEAEARRVFDVAAQENADGHAMDRSGLTIDDVAQAGPAESDDS